MHRSGCHKATNDAKPNTKDAIASRLSDRYSSMVSSSLTANPTEVLSASDIVNCQPSSIGLACRKMGTVTQVSEYVNSNGKSTPLTCEPVPVFRLPSLIDLTHVAPRPAR